MAEAATGWTGGMVERAKNVLEGWEAAVEGGHEYHQNLWGVGGRMEGLLRLNRMDTRLAGPQEDEKRRFGGWVVTKREFDPRRPYETGDLGFSVGS